MDEVVTGRCFCGAVRFCLQGKPLLTRACWCRDCQYLSAGNASINAVFPARALSLYGELSAGELPGYVSAADSGNQMRRRFCPRCGTPLFSEALREPDFVAVRVGTLDDREIGRPASTIWTSSAPSWGCWDPDTPSFGGHVPAVPDL